MGVFGALVISVGVTEREPHSLMGVFGVPSLTVPTRTPKTPIKERGSRGNISPNTKRFFHR
eukprot:751489-Prorocentrum_minimum.AAC.1